MSLRVAGREVRRSAPSTARAVGADDGASTVNHHAAAYAAESAGKIWNARDFSPY